MKNKKSFVLGMLAAALAFVAAGTLIACGGGKSVEQLEKEIQKIAEQMEELDATSAADAAKLAKLLEQGTKLAEQLAKAEAKAAGKPAKAAKTSAPKGSGKARPASEFQYDLTADGQGILIKGFTGAGGNVVVPEKIEDIPVVEIGEGVFAGVDTDLAEPNNKNGITAITLPNTVKKIGRIAFGRTAITKFVMPDSVTEIGTDLFYDCEALTEVHLSDRIEMIPGSLAGCKNLKKVNLPKSLKRIGEYVFASQGELNELVIPPELTSVEFGKLDYRGKWVKGGDKDDWGNKTDDVQYAFSGCGKLPIKTRQTIQGWGYTGSF